MKNKRIIIEICFITLICGISLYFGFIAPRNNCNCEENNQSENNTNNEKKLDLLNLLSLVLIKIDNDNIQSYKVSELDSQDINDMIYTYTFNYGITSNNGTIFQIEASEIEDKIKSFLGLENYQFDIAKGSRKYPHHYLKEIEKNNMSYYEIGRIDGSMDMSGDSYHFWNLKNINYEETDLIIDCEIEYSYPETPLHDVIGKASITFDMEKDIVLKSFTYKKYNTPLKVDTSGLHS